MRIPFSTFKNLHDELKPEIMHKFESIYESGWFIQGKEVKNLRIISQNILVVNTALVLVMDLTLLSSHY